MTYLQFHLVFIVPPLVALALVSWRAVRRGRPLAGRLQAPPPGAARNAAAGAVGGRAGAPTGARATTARADRNALLALGAHLALALLYTTPWDNYLLYREVWGYPPGRVLATLGYVPLEEYLFFLLQTTLTGLWLFWLARRGPVGGNAPRRSPRRATAGIRLRVGGAVGLLLVAVLGGAALSTPWGTYGGLILLWACPVLALQWGFGGDLVLQRWRLVGLGLALPTLYLWLADRIAIGLGIWWIDPEQTTGLTLAGLPLEEALFFLLTNMMVVLGLSLTLHPEAPTRLRSLWAARGEWWKVALLGWALLMVPVPLVPQHFTVLAYASTLLLALGTLGWALARYGGRALQLLALALAFGLLVEWLGSRTGVPFGRYTYHAAGPALLGVPLLVPLGWWAFTLVALAVVPRAPSGGAGWRRSLLLAPLALVAWDLALDPLMVAFGLWRFEAGGAYHGVPWTNFVGWYLAGALLVALLLRLEPRLAHDRAPTLRWLFACQALLMVVGLAWFELYAAAAATLLAMGAWPLLWLWEERRRGRPPATPAPREPRSRGGA